MLELIMDWLIPFVLTSVAAITTKGIKDLKTLRASSDEYQNLMKYSMISILRLEITDITEKYFDIGYLPDYARILLEDLYTNYKGLDGNNGIKELVEQCFKLPPVRSTETKD